MRQKKPFLIITFSATADAMALEKHCQAHGLPGRLIPIPREIHAGCGLAWKTQPEEQALFETVLSEAGVRCETVGVIPFTEKP